MSAIPYISNRFALKRFLGMTEEELAENERLWREENDENITPPPTDSAGELRSAGISSAGMSADMAGAGAGEDVAADGEEPAPVDGGTAPPPGTATGGPAGGGGTPPAGV